MQTCPNTDRYIDVKCAKCVQILLDIWTKISPQKQISCPNTARYIDVKSAKLVQTLLGVSTKKFTKKPILGVGGAGPI